MENMNFTGAVTVFFGNGKELLSYNDPSNTYEIAETADLLMYENNLDYITVKRVWYGGVKEYIKEPGEQLRITNNAQGRA